MHLTQSTNNVHNRAIVLPEDNIDDGLVPARPPSPPSAPRARTTIPGSNNRQLTVQAGSTAQANEGQISLLYSHSDGGHGAPSQLKRPQPHGFDQPPEKRLRTEAGYSRTQGIGDARESLATTIRQRFANAMNQALEVASDPAVTPDNVTTAASTFKKIFHAQMTAAVASDIGLYKSLREDAKETWQTLQLALMCSGGGTLPGLMDMVPESFVLAVAQRLKKDELLEYAQAGAALLQPPYPQALLPTVPLAGNNGAGKEIAGQGNGRNDQERTPNAGSGPRTGLAGSTNNAMQAIPLRADAAPGGTVVSAQRGAGDRQIDDADLTAKHILRRIHKGPEITLAEAIRFCGIGARKNNDVTGCKEFMHTIQLLLNPASDGPLKNLKKEGPEIMSAYLNELSNKKNRSGARVAERIRLGLLEHAKNDLEYRRLLIAGLGTMDPAKRARLAVMRELRKAYPDECKLLLEGTMSVVPPAPAQEYKRTTTNSLLAMATAGASNLSTSAKGGQSKQSAWQNMNFRKPSLAAGDGQAGADASQEGASTATRPTTPTKTAATTTEAARKLAPTSASETSPRRMLSPGVPVPGVSQVMADARKAQTAVATNTADSRVPMVVDEVTEEETEELEAPFDQTMAEDFNK